MVESQRRCSTISESPRCTPPSVPRWAACRSCNGGIAPTASGARHRDGADGAHHAMVGAVNEASRRALMADPEWATGRRATAGMPGPPSCRCWPVARRRAWHRTARVRQTRSTGSSNAGRRTAGWAPAPSTGSGRPMPTMRTMSARRRASRRSRRRPGDRRSAHPDRGRPDDLYNPTAAAARRRASSPTRVRRDPVPARPPGGQRLRLEDAAFSTARSPRFSRKPHEGVALRPAHHQVG